MKAKLFGSIVRVTVSPSEVERFGERWPCSGMAWASRGMTFGFEAKNGDLVEIFGEKQSYSGSAVAALADDAKSFAAKSGLLPEWAA